MDANYDQEMMRLWAIISDLSEQLNQHRATASALRNQAEGIKNQAIHTQTGFVLRRFNMDKSQEDYDVELDRMTSAIAAENQALQYDNKQLNLLIKEYEQTLETLMTTFRKRAHEIQEQELELIRKYEAALLAKEAEQLTEDLDANMAFSSSISTLGKNLRKALRVLDGEDTPESGDERDDMAILTASEWALDRECELARLEKENAELRRMLGLEVEVERTSISLSNMSTVGSASEQSGQGQRSQISEGTKPLTTLTGSGKGPQKILGGTPGSVGPFGTFKRMRLAG
ncbi:hypothetical protein BDM02DRAFT_3093974 [Thelephora ganbajun]|uniref:Uncharacterized protein n=1 Tax=Thelephora ganbajun TaxID=370292 RepID=A0ACB6ZKH0_THEGA|nr:hypothetical protein BDM02DRAFT_3093974 [Thelephora ganbajun]